MAFGNAVSEIVEQYQEVISSLPLIFQNFINLFLLVILIVAYSIFVWKFYRFIGTRNIFEFDFSKYNKAAHPFVVKFVASLFYLLEYILVIPFIVFFWYAIFTFFLIILVEEAVPISTILLISAIAIASIRMASYLPNYGEDLAKELAKILPFTFLAVSVLNPNIFTNLAGRVISRFSEISLFFNGIFNYLLFIISLEIILRLFEFLFGILGIEKD